MTDNHTSPEAASAASKVLQDGRTSDEAKSAAASALSQAGQQGDAKQTSGDVASIASDVLTDPETGDNSKTAAASALSQSGDDQSGDDRDDRPAPRQEDADRGERPVDGDVRVPELDERVSEPVVGEELDAAGEIREEPAEAWQVEPTQLRGDLEADRTPDSGDAPKTDVDQPEGQHTSPDAASAASKVLQDGRTSDEAKSAAASALSQAGKQGESKQTSEEVASIASDVLTDPETGDNSKSAAASALSQAGEAPQQ